MNESELPELLMDTVSLLFNLRRRLLPVGKKLTGRTDQQFAYEIDKCASDLQMVIEEKYPHVFKEFLTQCARCGVVDIYCGARDITTLKWDQKFRKGYNRPDFLHNEYCATCRAHMEKFSQHFVDLSFLNRSINQLEGVIRESRRNQNNRPSTHNVG